VQSSLVGQIFVYGDSLQSYLVSVIVVDPDNSKKWAAKNGLATDNLTHLKDNKEFKKEILDDFNRLATENKCSGLERIKKVHVTFEPWTPEGDILTPSMKLKRAPAGKLYKNEIDAMYAEGL